MVTGTRYVSSSFQLDIKNVPAKARMLCGHNIRDLVCEYRAEITRSSRIIIIFEMWGIIGREVDIPNTFIIPILKPRTGAISSSTARQIEIVSWRSIEYGERVAA